MTSPAEIRMPDRCYVQNPELLLAEQQALSECIDALIELGPNRLRCVLNLHNPQVASLVVERLLASHYRDQISQDREQMIKTLGL